MVIALVGFLWLILPAGLYMGSSIWGDNTIAQNTDKNPINVTVVRHKANNNVGVWNFRYGKVESAASAHAYREKGNEDVRSFFLDGLWNYILNAFNPSNWPSIWDRMTNTERHLFETEVTVVR